MSGFEAIDQAYVKETLDTFLPDSATVTRRNNSRTKGDYVPGVVTTVKANALCRVIPITDPSDSKVRMRDFPATLAERAQYYITIQNDGTVYKAGDVVAVGGYSILLIAVRYDHGSWNSVIRCIGCRDE